MKRVWKMNCKNKMVKTSVSLTDDEHKELVRISKKTGLSISKLVRMAVEDYLTLTQMTIVWDEFIKEV
jgi:hypothetical protein